MPDSETRKVEKNTAPDWNFRAIRKLTTAKARTHSVGKYGKRNSS